MKTRVCLKYFANDFLWKQDPFKFDLFEKFCNLMAVDTALT